MSAAVALLPWLFAFTAVASATEERPNIIIILTDDLGWGDLGCYGHPKFKTPRIDRLAAEGARLTQFQTPCPYCAPTRISIQTGRYPARAGLVDNPCPQTPQDGLGISDSEITLGDVFKKAGYATSFIGKWHLGHKPRYSPLKHGYGEYFGILYSNDMRPVELTDGDRMVEYPIVQTTLTKRYTERSIEFIRGNKDRPFLLYFAHAMPHKPLAAAEAFYEKSGAGLYGDVMAELDWSVGAVLDALAELKLDRRTLVFFTSDNGPWYGGSTGGLRGMKGRTWEGGIRVPLIARWPGRIPAGHVSDAPAISMDLFATSLAAAGIALPEDRTIDGRNILPVLTSNAPSPHDALISYRGDKLCTVRSGDWKLHLVPAGDDAIMKPDEKWVDFRRPDGVRMLAPYEQPHPSAYPGIVTGDRSKAMGLFNLKQDPTEQRDVAVEHPDVVKRLVALADHFRSGLEDNHRGTEAQRIQN